MKKPADIHKIHRFQSFSERIQAVNVDISRKIEKRAETPEDQETFFEEGLLKWRDLNQTAHFTGFYSEVQGCTQTFAQLLHNEEKVVDSLLRHLQVQDSLAVEALLDLVVQLARDLQKDFYKYFNRFFKAITYVLNSYTKSWETLEQAFSCLSYLFKFLWRKMITDMKKLLILYEPFLDENNRDYIRRFAAESLSYLMRKAKDKKQLFTVVFSRLKKNPDLADGVGYLIFEMVKGPKDFLHSCFADTFSFLLEYVGKLGSKSDQFSALHHALTHMCDHVDQPNSLPLWTVVQNEISKSLAAHHTDRLYCISLILNYVIEHKSGRLLPSSQSENWKLCTQTVIALLNDISHESFESRTVSSILDTVAALLPSNKKSPDTATVVKCLSLIYNKNSVRIQDEVFTFTEKILKYTQFEKDVLRRYLEFCNDCMCAAHDSQDDDDNIHDQFPLYSLSKLILYKRPDVRDGLYKPLQVYPLSLKTQQDRILSTLIDSLESAEKITEHISDVNLWTAFHVLPHYTTADKEKCGKLLINAFNVLTEIDDIENALLCHCLQACLWLGHAPDPQTIFKLLEKFPSEPDWCKQFAHVLNIVSIYLTYISTQSAAQDILTEERFIKIYPLLKSSISAYDSQIRLLTVRILSLFPISKPVTIDETEDLDKQESVTKDGLFTICLKAEEQQATLNNYREKLRMLRELDYDLIHDRIPLRGMLDDVPLRYLSSQLYVNFSMLWPETITLIESHGNSMNRDKLWKCFEELLTTAANNCMDPETLETTFDEGSELHPADEMFKVDDGNEPFVNQKTDHFNHRQLMWKAMHGFSHRCEKNSKTIVSLFFNFLEKEYYIADFYDAPTENIARKKDKSDSASEGSDVEEDEEPVASEPEDTVGDEEGETEAPADEEEEDDEDPDGSDEEEDKVSEADEEDGGSEDVDDDDEIEDDEEEMEVDTKDEDADDEPGETEHKEEKKKRTKAVYQTFITKLTLFSKFQHPLNISQEPRLSKLYNDLLLHRDMSVQQVVLKCLMTYKKKHLLQYHENFERLLNDTTFRTELTMFSIDSQNSIIKEEDRSSVMPVLLRILYGRMLHSTGKETKGRRGGGDLRRNIVLSFLAGCREEELSILLDLVTEPFIPLLKPDYIMNLDLGKAAPPRRILGLLSTVVVVMDKLSHLLTPHLGRLLNLLLSITRYAAYLLDDLRDEINFRTIHSMKNARQTAIKCIAEFMDRNSSYVFSKDEVDQLYNVAVWPQMSRLVYEGTSAPTSLLLLIETWSKYRRYMPMLLKLSPGDTKDYPLSAVMRLLASPQCKLSVGSVIMDIVESVLDFHTDTTRQDMEAESDSELMVPVGETTGVDDSAGSYEVGMLIPHLQTIIGYIRERVSRASIKGTNQTAFPMKELNILSVCSQYVDAPELCAALLTQLLPFISGGSGRLSESIQCGIIRTLGSLARKTSNIDDHICKLVMLSSALTQRLARMELVKMFDSLKDLSNECKEVAEFTREVNAFDRSRIEEPDYDSRLGAFREIVWWDYEKIPLSLVAAIIHNSCFTLKHVNDMALRDSASAALQTLVKKMPEVHYLRAMNTHLAPLLRVGIQIRNDTIRSEFLAVLRDMVNTKPDIYEDMAGLGNPDNIDDDFWENIRHIQVSRRLKGLNRLMRHLEKTQMKNSTLTKYLLPLVFSFIKDESDYHKKNAMVDVCIATIGALCKQLTWSAYKAQLKQALMLLTKLNSNKMAVRLICTIMDSFHYDVSLSTYVEAQVGLNIATDKGKKRGKTEDSKEAIAQSERPEERPSNIQPGVAVEPMNVDIELPAVGDDVDEGIDVESETHDMKSPDIGSAVDTVIKCPADLATNIHAHVIGSILPQLHQILSQKASGDDLHKENKNIHPDQEEVLRIPLAVAIVKLLQKISTATLERHLPSVLMKVCYFAKSRAEDIRDAARQTLSKMLTCLGIGYMSTIADHLKSTLTKGYQVAVLGYSLHYILNQNMGMVKPGDLSSCLHNLVNINMTGLFGSSGHEKDIDKFDTSKEKRRPMYYEMFGLLARFSAPSTIAVILIPLKEKLDSIHKAKDMSKLRQSLEKVAEGLLLNTGLTAETYLKFTYSLVTESLNQFLMDKRAQMKAKADAKRKEKQEKSLRPTDTMIVPAEPGRLQPLPPSLKKSNKHMLVEFGMKLLHMLMKKNKVLHSSEDHARMVDPFIVPLTDALNSEHVPVIIESLICMTFMLKFKGLPTLVDKIEVIINQLFVLLKTYSGGGTTSGEGYELVQLCFRLISQVLKTCSFYQWTEDKIEILLTYAETDLLDHNRQATAFSLLKAIISRKLISKLLYEVIKQVEQLSVKSESSDVRLNCRQVVLQFLLDYPLGKGLPKHITFYLDNLDYELQDGRESIYEMLGAILTSFPQKTVHTYSSTIFISLARARVNDESEKCRKLAALGIKTLLGRVERNVRGKLFSMAFKWLQETQIAIVQMAAQIIGIFVEVESDGFSSRLNDMLSVLEKTLQPTQYLKLDGQSDESMDLQLYHVILLVMKIIKECPRMLRQITADKILEHIQEHMLHPHTWVRFASAQVFGLVFSTYNPDELVAAFLAAGTRSSSQPESVNKNHRNMMFLLRNMRQKLRDFTADFCTQLSSQNMQEAFAAQIVKNLVFLVKVIRRLPESKPSAIVANDEELHPVDIKEEEEEEVEEESGEEEEETGSGSVSDSESSIQVEPRHHSASTSRQLPENTESNDGEEDVQSVTVGWLIRRLGKVAMFEATSSPRESVKRTNVFKCLAAISVELGPELLLVHLKDIIPPIHREITMIKLFPETEELRNLANEVSTLLKNTVGVSEFSSAYAAVHQAASQRKAERKRKLAQQAVMNPDIAASKKMRMHLKKGTGKRTAKKVSRYQGSRGAKVGRAPRVARDMAILQ